MNFQLITTFLIIFSILIPQIQCADYGEGGEVIGIILFIVSILGILITTIYFCCFYDPNNRPVPPREQVIPTPLISIVQIHDHSKQEKIWQKLVDYQLSKKVDFQLCQECAICLEKLSENGFINEEEQKLGVVKLPCGHLFHGGCVRTWIFSKDCADVDCPICKMNILQGLEKLDV